MNRNVERVDEEAEDEPVIKKLRSSVISGHVESTEFRELFVSHWSSFKPVKNDGLEIITSPYRVCKISNFLRDDEDLISLIKDELKDVEADSKVMDLYQFRQTEDLANVKSKNIADLYRTFKFDVSDWMEKNTKVPLSGKISMSSSSYSDTDYLLCHDDNMGDRRIAFILYLSKNWTPEDGGALDIFDTDENGQPKDVVRSLIPEYNSLVFFEVVDNSYHQVAEVTSPDKSRLSINGWFHGPLRDSDKQRRPDSISEYFEPESTEVDLVSNVSKIYLYETIVKEIQNTIEKDSFIYLPGFLHSERYEALSDEVKSEKIKWVKIGPADLMNYEIAREDTLPKTLKEFYNIFKSIHMFHLLKQYTELDLVPETSDMTPKMKIELQRWSRGCYMLINDKVTTQNENIVTTQNSLDEHLVPQSDPELQENTDKGIPNDSQHKKPVLKNSREGSESKEDNKSAKRKDKAIPKVVSTSRPNLKEKHSTAGVSGESDSSDIEDYLSGPQNDSESEISEPDDDETDAKPGTLDVLLQFHTNNATEDVTIDYIDPSQKDGALIHIPPQDNHLCLVYRTADTCRCNKYVNHYCNGYFYTLVCSYYE